ncbi:MAG: UDPGP type 1 family protein [Planctomycetes bacterium]|nr:UDPGP type 1 family protein [Planctomycetota bacterium]
MDDLSPATVLPARPTSPEIKARCAEAKAVGADQIAKGKVAAFTVAGGQGTRLGVDGPKGCVVVTPIVSKSLFQLFAEMVLAARRKYQALIPWYIMTNVENHTQTVSFFDDHKYFGLPREDIMFFPQGMLPAFDFHGQLILAEKDHLSLAPDGHGGSLKALRVSGAIADMRRRSVDTVSYFQVDNPLVHPFDPLFIGLHVQSRSEMSTKVAKKADDLEKVGNVCKRGDRVAVVEYTEFPEALAKAKNVDGSRRFDAANLAIHLFDVDFVDRISSQAALPFRRAEKVVPYVDDHGVAVKPSNPNAIKLETFVFDALPLAERPLLLEVDRGEEFSPVKNATGVDSLESSKRDQVLRACRWLEVAGVSVPRNADGSPNATVSIGPFFALDSEDVRNRADRIPPISRGAEVVLE